MTDLNIDRAIEAATEAVKVHYDDLPGRIAEAALLAALPHIRAALADEIEATFEGCTHENCQPCMWTRFFANRVRGEEL